MDLESIYMVLFGASGCDSGAHYDVVRKWIKKCEIVDERVISEGLFIKTYERLCPNREPMSLVQFAQMMGIMARETKQEVSTLAAKFQNVRRTIIDEIQEEHRRNSTKPKEPEENSDKEIL